MPGIPNPKDTGPNPPAIPPYLTRHYWWAYVHPRAAQIFERDWLINLILLGHYRELRDAAITAVLAGMARKHSPRVLQIACVYGNLSQCLLQQLPATAGLDVVDVLAVQLNNLRRKLPHQPRLHLHQQDAAALSFAPAQFDSALLFFLLHEQPDAVRRATLAEAWRVLKPGGRLVVVDYHRPKAWHPAHWPMKALLASLEPFALDLWRDEIAAFFPTAMAQPQLIQTQDYFGGLYQLRVWEKSQAG